MAAKKAKKSMKKASTKKKMVRKPTTAKASKTQKKTLKPVKPTVGKKALTKSQITTYIAETCDVKRNVAGAMLEGLNLLFEAHLEKRGPGEFNLPGILKCRVVRKPATKARKGINPFTGQPTVFKAKPARNIVKIRPLKKLKEQVA